MPEDTKVIWMYWDRGLEKAPELVRVCIESWRRRNPGWRVQVLDEKTQQDWVDMSDVRRRNPKLTVQAFSDILRWRLLAQYGGVWADATLYCNRALDDWLLKHTNDNGFFAFRSPAVFLYHSWFLAGRPSNALVKEMNWELDRYFVTYGGYQHYWDMRAVWRVYHLLEKRAKHLNYWLWRSVMFRRFLKASPYFFSNYLTGSIIHRSPEAGKEFEYLTENFGECPHALQLMTAPSAPPAAEEVRLLLEGCCPVQKLTNKRFVKEWSQGGIIDLLAQHGRG